MNEFLYLNIFIIINAFLYTDKQFNTYIKVDSCFYTLHVDRVNNAKKEKVSEDLNTR